MKILNLCLFLFLFSYSGFSQDLIVTVGGDSINCKIHKIGEERIFFLDNRPGINKNASLSVKYIKLFTYNFYGNAYTLPLGTNQSFKPSISSDFPKWQTKYFVGLSRLNEKVDPSISPVFYAYMEELKSGFHLGGSLDYFVKEKTAFGIRSSFFITYNSMDSVWIQFPGQSKMYGSLSEEITVFYLGPEINLLFNRDDFKYLKFHFDFSIGFISYKDVGAVVIPINEEGYGMGFTGEFGVDYYLSDEFAFGLYVSYLPIRINKIYVSAMGQRQQIQLDSEEMDNLSRFDFGVFMKILR